MEVAGFKIFDRGDICNVCVMTEILAEFLGTFLLIMIGGGTVEAASYNDSSESAKFVQIAFGVGLGLGTVVHLFSDISGGQVNPAVSVGLFFARQLSLYKAVVYIIAQIIGALIAGGILHGLFGEVKAVIGFSPKINEGQAFFLEMLGAFVLVTLVLATFNERRNQDKSYLQPLSIALVVTALLLFLIPLSGGGFNPARSLATNIVQNRLPTSFWVYVIGPIVGGALAGILYEFVFNPYYHGNSNCKKKGGAQDVEQEPTASS